MMMYTPTLHFAFAIVKAPFLSSQLRTSISSKFKLRDHCKHKTTIPITCLDSHKLSPFPFKILNSTVY